MSFFKRGLLAQSVEQVTENHCVLGSIPRQATTFKNFLWPVSSVGRASD